MLRLFKPTKHNNPIMTVCQAPCSANGLPVAGFSIRLTGFRVFVVSPFHNDFTAQLPKTWKISRFWQLTLAKTGYFSSSLRPWRRTKARREARWRHRSQMWQFLCKSLSSTLNLHKHRLRLYFSRNCGYGEGGTRRLGDEVPIAIGSGDGVKGRRGSDSPDSYRGKGRRGEGVKVGRGA